MLSTFTIEAVVSCDERNACAIRKFIERNSMGIKRLYPADYSRTSVRSMLRMLGFEGKMIPGIPRPGKLAVETLFCYEDDYELLQQLINIIKD